MAKLFSSQVAERVTSISLELFGGYGYTKDYPAEKFYRDAKIGAIYEGTRTCSCRRSRRDVDAKRVQANASPHRPSA